MLQVQRAHVTLRLCVSYHVADLHVAVTEDNGVGGVPHWKHDPEWHTHGGRDQSVEGVDVQRLWLEGGKRKKQETVGEYDECDARYHAKILLG